MKYTISLILGILVFTFCYFSLPAIRTDPSGATRVLEGAGYTNIEITGWRPFMAGKEDWYATGFRATGPHGQSVSGAVTGGIIFKGNTIRLD